MTARLHLVLGDERRQIRQTRQSRRDKRGRRIGYNWWREYNTDALRHAEDAWQALRESALPAHSVAGAAHSGVAMYQLSEAEFREMHPRPTLKQFLLDNAGINRENPAA